ncbi:MAG: hypothetical protein QXR62_05720 [Candidatus Bathyarchaeia archaeon]
MLLSEMVRRIDQERILINDPTQYYRAAGDWGVLKDYGPITLPTPSLLLFTLYNVYDTGLRLKIGNYYVWGHPAAAAGVTYVGMAYVPAGTHSVVVESRRTTGGQAIKNFRLGRVVFSDGMGFPLNLYSDSINITPTSRKTCIGTLAETVLAIQVFAYTPAAQTNFENVGETLTNGVSLRVNGIQVNWTTRTQDTNSVGAAYATYISPYTIGQLTIELSRRNTNTICHINIFVCPWLLSSSFHAPVSLSFPQGSTLYLILEPLTSNPTKTVRIGKERTITFGDIDYYYIASGADILVANYTFEAITVESSTVLVSGLGGCISTIAVDVRA